MGLPMGQDAGDELGMRNEECRIDCFAIFRFDFSITKQGSVEYIGAALFVKGMMKLIGCAATAPSFLIPNS